MKEEELLGTLPQVLTLSMLDELVEAGVIYKLEGLDDNRYLPGHPSEHYTICDALGRLGESGLVNPPTGNTPALERVIRSLKTIDRDASRSPRQPSAQGDRSVMKLFLPVLAAFAFTLVLSAADGIWRADGAKLLKPGEPKMEVGFPGGAQLYREPDRLTFRPQRAAFDAQSLEMEIRVEADTPEPVKGVVFFKNKDGLWFQSIEEFSFTPGEWKKIGVRLDRAPAATGAASVTAAVFDAEAATQIFSAGISVYGSETRTFTLECRNLRFAESAKNSRSRSATGSCRRSER